MKAKRLDTIYLFGYAAYIAAGFSFIAEAMEACSLFLIQGTIFTAAGYTMKELRTYIDDGIIAAAGISAAGITNVSDDTKAELKIAAGDYKQSIEVFKNTHKDFPGTRVKLQDITLSDGETVIGIYMPNTFDTVQAIDASEPDTESFAFHLAAKSIGYTLDEYMCLPYTDTQKVLEILGTGIRIIRPDTFR